jgi:hypothetical protein
MSRRALERWLTVFACLTGVASPSTLLAQDPKAPDAYTVTEVNSMFGPTATMEISRDGSRAVIDQTVARDGYPNGFHTRAIYDLQTGKTYALDLNQAVVGCSAGTFSGDWGDPFAASAGLATLKPKDLGVDTVNGTAAKVMEVAFPGQSAPAKVWVDGKYGLVLKLDMGGKTVIEVKKVSFAKPAASVLALPAACTAAAATPTEAERIGAATGESGANFANAIMPPAAPSSASCTVLLRTVRAGSMAPIASGFQVALDTTVDVDHPASYQIGLGPGGHATFSGGGLKEMTGQLQTGVLRIDAAPARFDLEMAFGTAGSASALIYRQCFGPQTVLLYVVKNPDKLSDGTNYWLWVKSGKYAAPPGR